MLIAFSAASARGDDSPAERLPVPNSTAQTKIVNSIRAQYKEDYARRDAAEQLALAKNFQQQAAVSSNDPVRQYVLLREARELATNAGNFDAAFSIVDDTAKLFIVDPLELKANAMANAVDRSTIPKSELMENYLKVCNDALFYGNAQMAYQACLLATQIARATRNPATIERVRQYELRVHDARREMTAVLAAVAKLKNHPDDPDASVQVGRYLCFAQHRWDEGLPLLAHGSDKRLRDLAEKDLEGPNDAPAMVDLADAWWDFPDSKQTPQKVARERAVHWYEQALPRLSGEKKAYAEERMKGGK